MAGMHYHIWMAELVSVFLIILFIYGTIPAKAQAQNIVTGVVTFRDAVPSGSGANRLVSPVALPRASCNIKAAACAIGGVNPAKLEVFIDGVEYVPSLRTANPDAPARSYCVSQNASIASGLHEIETYSSNGGEIYYSAVAFSCS